MTNDMFAQIKGKTREKYRGFDFPPIGARKLVLRSHLILQATNNDTDRFRARERTVERLYRSNFPTIQPGVNDAPLSLNRSAGRLPFETE